MLHTVVLAFLLSGSLSNAYTLQHANACYGSRASDLMTVSCDGRYRFAIGNIKVGAKNKTSACNNEDSDSVPNNDTCCGYAAGDGCYFDYRPTSDDNYALFDSNIGKLVINLKIRAEWIAVDTRCSNEFLGNTNYMTMDYYCVPFDSPIEVSKDSARREGREVFLMSQNYPNATAAQPHSLKQMCSLTTQCYDVIRVSVFHFNFSDIGATHIEFLDPLGNINFRSITNHTYSRFVQMNLVTSSSNFMQLNISVEGANHPFMVGFDSQNGNNVVLSCGTAANHTAPFCPTTTTTTTTTSTTTTSPTTTSTEPGIKDTTTTTTRTTTTTIPSKDPVSPNSVTASPSGNQHESSNSTGIIAGIVAGVLVLIVVVIVLVVWRKYINKRSKAESNHSTGSLIRSQSTEPSQPRGVPPMSTFDTPRPHTDRSNKPGRLPPINISDTPRSHTGPSNKVFPT